MGGVVQMAHKKSATLRELQSLIGTLNFACRVVRLGRLFLQRIIQLTHKVTKPHHHIKLNAGFREDIRMWKISLSKWKAVTFLCNQNWKHLKHCIFMQMPQVPWALGDLWKPVVSRKMSSRLNGIMSRYKY